MTDRPNPLAADFADQIAAHQQARQAGAAPTPVPRSVRREPLLTSVRDGQPDRPGRRAQRDFLVPSAVTRAVDAAGVRWADLIETAWWRHGPSSVRDLERSPCAGEVRVRPSLLVDVHAEIKAAASHRGWSASQLVTALVLRELADRG